MKRLLAVLLALLLLSSCASMLERDYLVTSEHVEDAPQSAQAFYRVENYAALTAALNSYVEEGMEEGVLRFPTTYGADLTVEMERARRRLMEEDPLGCYALEELTYHISRIISYYEVTLAFTYREDIDPAALSDIPTARNGAALEGLVAAALTELRPELLVRLEGSRTGREAVAAALEEAENSRALLHVGFPRTEVTLSPEDSPRAVARLEFTYPQSAYVVARRREQTWSAAGSVSREGEDDPLAALRDRCVFDPEGGSTAYDALILGRADEEGMARAYQTILQYDGESCRTARMDGCWYVVFPDGSRVSPAWWPEEPPRPEEGGTGE